VKTVCFVTVHWCQSWGRGGGRVHGAPNPVIGGLCLPPAPPAPPPMFSTPVCRMHLSCKRLKANRSNENDQISTTFRLSVALKHSYGLRDSVKSKIRDYVVHGCDRTMQIYVALRQLDVDGLGEHTVASSRGANRGNCPPPNLHQTRSSDS